MPLVVALPDLAAGALNLAAGSVPGSVKSRFGQGADALDVGDLDRAAPIERAAHERVVDDLAVGVLAVDVLGPLDEVRDELARHVRLDGPADAT